MYKVIQQDCLEWMKKQADNSIDIILTSPPYNLKGLRKGHRMLPDVWRKSNVDYSVYNDDLPEEDYYTWQINILNEAHRILKNDGSIFYQHKIRHWERKGYHPMCWIGKSNAQFYQEIIWNRGNTTAIDKRYLFCMTERIYWLCKGKPYVNKENATHKNDIWNINPERNNSHPAPFPEELAKACLSLVYKPNAVVYDPFAGSGTTLKVANDIGLNSIGNEIDPAYCQAIDLRIGND
jgi:modification methylase